MLLGGSVHAMTSPEASATYLVPTDGDGTQHVGEDITRWPLPELKGDSWVPADPIEPLAGTPLVLLGLDSLLDDL